MFCSSKKGWEVTVYIEATKTSQMPNFWDGVILVISSSWRVSNFSFFQ